MNALPTVSIWSSTMSLTIFSLSASPRSQAPLTRNVVAISPSAYGSRPSGGEQVTGDLVDDEPVERQVAVERRHDPVAVPPRFERLAHRVPGLRVAVVV